MHGSCEGSGAQCSLGMPGSSTSEKRGCFALSRRRYEAHALDPNSQIAKLTTRVTKGNEKLEWILGLYMSE